MLNFKRPWKYIKENQGELVVFCNYYKLPWLLDFKPRKGSKFIWSITGPIDEEAELDLARVENWLKQWNLPVVNAHASTHLSFPEMVEMVEKINSKMVVPVHTENPKKFVKEFKGMKIITKEKIEL